MLDIKRIWEGEWYCRRVKHKKDENGEEKEVEEKEEEQKIR